jgi:hypothetical protein
MTLLTFRDGTSGTALNEIQFGEHGTWGDGDSLCITHTNSGTRILGTTNLLRDVTAWYNIHVRGDLDNGTASEKLKIYINNVEATYATDNRGSYSEMTGFKAGAWTIGDYYNYGYSPACLLTLFTYTDGHKYLPTDFCEVKEGALIPKDPSVTYGNGGFRLAFASGTGTGTASSTTIGADTSGNDNHWTTTNIVAGNVHPDNPENNFCTLNPINNQTSATLSEGNLKVVGTGANWDNVGSTFAVSSGKWYWEVRADSISESEAWTAGIRQTGFAEASQGVYISGGEASSIGAVFNVQDNNKKATNYSGGTGQSSFTSDIAAGDVVQFRLNLDDNELSVSVDGSDKGKLFDITANLEYTPFLSIYNTSGATMNFGQDSSFAGTETAGGNTDGNGKGDFHSAVPSDYLALCSANLPEPTISPNADTQSTDHFDTLIYTGDGNDGRSITGLSFSPDLNWVKNRSNAGNDHMLTDSSRGGDKQLNSNGNYAEGTATNKVESLDSGGFTVGQSVHSSVNSNTHTYVAWNWKANGGTTTTNDASSTSVGSIDSVYQANTTAGFSIVTFTTDGVSSGTVAHGLGVQPKLLLGKTRNHDVAWAVQSPLLATNLALILDTTSAAYNPGYNHWNDTHPTSSVFSVGGYMADHSDLTNPSTKIVYCFAEVAGFSKIGLYTGNGNANGPYVHTGFKPAWIMIKRTDTTGSWYIYDYKRLLRNPLGSVNQPLLADTTGAEGGADASWYIDGLSNGFKLKNASNFDNASGGTYLYMAFAEMPEKYSNAR